MNFEDIINRYYEYGSVSYNILVEHSRFVTRKALQMAKDLSHLNPDMEFIEDAAMLHDIGIFSTEAPSIGCKGNSPYLCHGFLGRQLLDDLGLDARYGLVCERHTGAGITKNNILKHNLPLPQRDMVPQSLEEKIICIADKYHSKSAGSKQEILSTQRIIERLGNIDPGHARRFTSWIEEFNLV